MYLFINYLIKEDFELFINSNNEELYIMPLVLVYSNNIDEKDNLLKVDNIYEYFENKHKINKEAIKNIVSDFDAFIKLQLKRTKRKNIFMKTYRELSHNP